MISRNFDTFTSFAKVAQAPGPLMIAGSGLLGTGLGAYRAHDHPRELPAATLRGGLGGMAGSFGGQVLGAGIENLMNQNLPPYASLPIALGGVLGGGVGAHLATRRFLDKEAALTTERP